MNGPSLQAVAIPTCFLFSRYPSGLPMTAMASRHHTACSFSVYISTRSAGFSASIAPICPKGCISMPRAGQLKNYNVPHSVDSLLKKRHPNDTLNRDLFCRQ